MLLFALYIGALGIVWSILWIFFTFDTPSKHPRIDPKERDYIEQSQGLLASAKVSLVGCLHDQANIEQTLSWLKQTYWNPPSGPNRLRLLADS